LLTELLKNNHLDNMIIIQINFALFGNSHLFTRINF